MDDIKSVSDLSTEIFDMNTKLCKDCNIIFPIAKFLNRRAICSDCFNLERKKKRAEKTKEILSINPILISKIFIEYSTIDSSENTIINNHINEIENLPPKEKEISQLLFLLDNIAEYRIKNIGSWIQIGRIFYSICSGDNIGLTHWISYSSTYDIDCSNCKILYNTFKSKIKLTINTIYYYLKLDKPDFYDRYIYISSSHIYANCLKLTNNSIAKALYNYFHLDFYYCNNTNTWYYYNGKILKKDNKNSYLKNNIINRFIPIFEKIKTSFLLCNDYTQKEKDIQTLAFDTLIKKLETNTFINQCIEASSNLFMIENIDTYLDSDHCIISLSNGIIETIPELNIAIPRNSIPEDYLTKQINVIYDSSISFEDKNMKLLLHWLHQLFPYEDLFEYVLKLCSSFLVGKNVSKKFYIFTGKSNGGKSSFCKLLEQTFGMYYTTVSSSFLDKTMNSNSGGPTPELMQLKGAHITMVPEVDDTILLSSNKIKKFTGNDSFFARKCNSNGEIVGATSAFGMCCNNIPPFDSIDSAIMGRLQVVPFMSEYRENVEDDYEKHIFCRNNNFETEILPYLIQPFLWLLVKTYPTFAKEGLKNVKTIIDHTEKYFIESDPYSRFKNERLDVMDDSYMLGVSDIYPQYVCWFNENYPGKPKITKPIVIRELNRILGDSCGRNMWLGYALKT